MSSLPKDTASGLTNTIARVRTPHSCLVTHQDTAPPVEFPQAKSPAGTHDVSYSPICAQLHVHLINQNRAPGPATRDSALRTPPNRVYRVWVPLRPCGAKNGRIASIT